MLILFVTLAVCWQAATASPDQFIRFVDSPALNHDFVDSHNQYRNNVEPPATNMLRLEWNAALEESAKAKVKQCSFMHTDPPPHTKEFNVVGENLYAGDEFRISDAGYGISLTWFNESKYYDIDGNPTCLPGYECGHYKQLVWAESQKIGCAMAMCSHIEHGHGRTLVACHYGPVGNKYTPDHKEIPPYIVGSSCRDCPEEAPNCIARLCI